MQVVHKKPAPDIYRFVLRELGESAVDCVAIEDSRQGLAAAKRAGLFTVVTPSDWTRGEDFSAADLVLTSWDSCARRSWSSSMPSRPNWAVAPAIRLGGEA